MLIKSPMEKKKVHPNRPKKAPHKESARRPTKSRIYGKKISEQEKKKRISLLNLKPWKVITGAIVLGVFGVLYLSHVFATQQLLRDVQQLEREYRQAKRMNDNYRLTYERMTGPAEIYEKAKDRGFINGGPAERVIEVKNIE